MNRNLHLPLISMAEELSYVYGRESSEDFSFTDRDLKGFHGEVLVKNELDRLNISYTSNPLENIQLWKQFQRHGVDFRIESLNIELEVKNITGKVFKSWILRDWIPRFSFNGEKRVVAIPQTTRLPQSSLELLFTYDISIVCYDSIRYIISEDGNKVVLTSNVESGGSSNVKIGEYSDGDRDEGNRIHGFQTIVKASNNELKSKTVQDSRSDSRNSTENVKLESNNIQLASNQNTSQVYVFGKVPIPFENWKPLCRFCYSKRYCDLYKEYRHLIERWKKLEEEKPKRQITLFEDPLKVKEELNKEFKPKYEKLEIESQHLFNRISACIEKRLRCEMNPYINCQCFRVPKRRRKFSYLRIISERTLERYRSQARKNNRDFVCYKCKRPFKLGDKLFTFRDLGVFFCKDCYETKSIDYLMIKKEVESIEDKLSENNHQMYNREIQK